MKRFLITLGITLSLFLTTLPSYVQVGVIKADPFDLAIPKAITSSVSLFTGNNRGEWFTCSGVVIKNTPTESIVLTAKHCVTMKSEILVEGLEINTMGISMYTDLAYLKLNQFIPYKTPTKLSNYIPKNGDKIVVVGYPDTELYLNKGTMYIATNKEQLAKVKIIGGCSGGGAFNAKGELVGIMVAHIPIFKTSFLIKLEDIHKFVTINKLLQE